MANAVINQEKVPEISRKQLAVAVKSIQWSYAIFWSLSATQQGVLQWSDGYYNGDIKTRKTVQALLEIQADKIGIQRSEQLRDLYESLLEGETDQTKRPSAALSPEDLSDAEWYYLVCMSFVFNLGHGLPGRVLANGETIWLCNAQYADSKLFVRSLLAKSASIQTVVCFPYLGGVIELGATELVPEDKNLLQHIKASLLDFSKPVCSGKTSSVSLNADDDRDPVRAKVNHKIVDLLDLENLYSPTEEIKLDPGKLNGLHENVNEDFANGSHDECSNGCERNFHTEDLFMLEVNGVNAVSSQVQSWYFMDDDFTNGVQNSLNSSDSLSEAHANQQKDANPSSIPGSTTPHFEKLQEGTHRKLSSLDLHVDDDLHYKRTVSAILGTSNLSTQNQGFHTCGYKPNFIRWKKGATYFHRPIVQQNIVKKILFDVPLMHISNSVMSQKEIGGKYCLGKSENGDSGRGLVLLEKRREEEKFLVLRSMVPSISEIDKKSILDDTIKYLNELEAKVKELESCKDSADLEMRPRRTSLEVVEQTSDNYENCRKVDNGKKSWINKRKAYDMDESHETGSDLNRVVTRDGLVTMPDVKVSIKEQEVVIDITCPYREYLLLDIVDAINNLHLDAHTVQSSTLEGVFKVTLKSKFRGTAVAPAAMIKQALQRVTNLQCHLGDMKLTSTGIYL